MFEPPAKNKGGISHYPSWESPSSIFVENREGSVQNKAKLAAPFQYSTYSLTPRVLQQDVDFEMVPFQYYPRNYFTEKFNVESNINIEMADYEAVRFYGTLTNNGRFNLTRLHFLVDYYDKEGNKYDGLFLQWNKTLNSGVTEPFRFVRIVGETFDGADMFLLPIAPGFGAIN